MLVGGTIPLRTNTRQRVVSLAHGMHSAKTVLAPASADVGGRAVSELSAAAATKRPAALHDRSPVSDEFGEVPTDRSAHKVVPSLVPYALSCLSSVTALPALSIQGEQIPDLITSVAARMVGLVGSPANVSSLPTNAASLACQYHLGGGGRRVRARLALHGALSLGLDPSDAVTIAVTAELVHNASLIHDDLQDRDRQRRGSHTVWAMFGDNVALCAGDLMLSSAYAALASFSRRETLAGLVALVHGAVASAVHGQSAETGPYPTVDPRQGWYEAIAARKSGSLLALPLELALFGAARSSALPLARRAAEAFAVGYQIADDVEDVVADTERQTGAGTSNFVLALRQADPGGDAMSEARRVATDYLLLAANLAEDLPAESGHLLRDLSRQVMVAL